MMLQAIVACAGVTFNLVATAMRLRFEIDSPASDDQLAMVLRQTERTCVVFQTLRNPPPVEVCLDASLAEQEARDHAVHDQQHGRHQLGLRIQHQAQRDGQRQHPLAHRRVGDDVVHQVGRRLAGGTRHRREGVARVARGATRDCRRAIGVTTQHATSASRRAYQRQVPSTQLR